MTSNSQGEKRSGDDHLAAAAETTAMTATTTIEGGKRGEHMELPKTYCEEERAFSYCERKLPVTLSSSSEEEGDSGHTHLSRLKL